MTYNLASKLLLLGSKRPFYAIEGLQYLQKE